MSESAPDPEKYNGKTLDQLADAEVLALAGGFGRAIIGDKLADRRDAITKTNPGGVFGPALLDPHHGQSPNEPPPASAPDDAWVPFSRGDLVKLAAQHGVSHKHKATRTDLITALMEAGVSAPDFTTFGETDEEEDVQ